MSILSVAMPASFLEFFFSSLFSLYKLWHAVVKALLYMPQGHGFETRWREYLLSINLMYLAALGPGFYSAGPDAEMQMFLACRERSVCEADNLAATF
jgi:hypothetical protein